MPIVILLLILIVFILLGGAGIIFSLVYALFVLVWFLVPWLAAAAGVIFVLKLLGVAFKLRLEPSRRPIRTRQVPSSSETPSHIKDAIERDRQLAVEYEEKVKARREGLDQHQKR